MKQHLERHKTYLKRGDTVRVVAGAHTGSVGKVLRVLRKTNRVVVERINMMKRHQRPTATMRQGGIIEKEAPIHISNVQLVVGRDQEPTRIRREGTGRSKARIAKKTGERID